MSLFGNMHARFVFVRRTRVLAETIATMIPHGASVLDVGCGDGTIADLIRTRRPDVTIVGIDVLVRPITKIPVSLYDGVTFPFADQSHDVVLFVDVLHHTTTPAALAIEAARVARKAVIIKDHIADSWLDRSILSFMDWVGNAPHGVVLPYNYLSRWGWLDLMAKAKLVTMKTTGDVPLYPWPLSLAFGRKLHFVSASAPR